MLENLTLFPPYLMIITVVMVIIPFIATILAIQIRYHLYNHLMGLSKKIQRLLTNQSLGEKPSIVKILEKRYHSASFHLENVNTPALIDQCYGQETLKKFSLQLSYDQWDYFCRLLPNLLISVGLLGTLLGISINLINLSQIIINLDPKDLNQGNIVIEQLKIPLQSMGIAFLTSLFALSFSSVLTIINLLYNTNKAKLLLISSLEDYLDNIYQIQVEGHTRLDKAVERMTETQVEFLNRFSQEVGEIMENTLGKAANNFIQENAKSHALAERVYENFLQSSGTIAKSADNFQEASLTFKQQITEIKMILPELNYSSETFKESATIFQEGAEKIKSTKFLEKLEEHTQSLASTQAQMSDATQGLKENIDKVVNNNIKSTSLAKHVYKQLLTASETMNKFNEGFEQSILVFADNINTFKNIIPEFTEFCHTLNQSVTSFEGVARKIDQSNYLETMENVTEKLVNTQTEVSKNNQVLRDNLETIIASSKKNEELGQRIYKQILEAAGIIQGSAHKLLTASTNVEKSQFTQKLLEFSAEFNQAILSFNNGVNEFQAISKNLPRR